MPTMRILGLSDIHGRKGAVERLRELESNRFDALVVAGDIGNGLESAIAVMEILATFGCPVLYVFGNHDHDLPYDNRFADGCRHLHGCVIDLGGLAFAGYSGLPTHWGRNPIAAAVRADVESGHAGTLATLLELEAAEKDALAPLTSAHSDVSAGRSKAGGSVDAPARSERSRSEAARLREEARIRRPLQTFLAGKAYAAYRRDAGAADRAALERNRAELSELVAGRDPRSVVVVTHERQCNTGRDMPGIGLFLFGHRHGFADTEYGGSRFVNVSALDRLETVMPAGSRGGPGFVRSLRRADFGSYAILETTGTGIVTATCRHLYADPKGWVPYRGIRLRSPMVPQDDP